MTRRLVRFAVVVLAALSLLLCVASAALWVRGRSDGDQFIFTAGGRLWWVMPGRGRINVLSVERWPRPERFRWVRDNSSNRVPTVSFSAPGGWSEWRVLGIAGENAQVSTWLNEEGMPVSLSESNKPGARSGGRLHPSGLMPYRSVQVPLWMPLALGGVVPGVILARRVRRSLSRRRRAAQGLCVQCGYDLRSSPEHCPECGASPGAVAASSRG